MDGERVFIFPDKIFFYLHTNIFPVANFLHFRSTATSDLQLGEHKNGFGYGGTGKISEACKFKSYGRTFGVGDVVGAYLDLNTDPVVIKFTVSKKISRGLVYFLIFIL